jgi:hypothetical protein
VEDAKNGIIRGRKSIQQNLNAAGIPIGEGDPGGPLRAKDGRRVMASPPRGAK